MVSAEILRELYRVDNRYWKTGDVDILPKRRELAGLIDKTYYSEVAGIARIITQRRYPVAKLAEVLTLLGYEVEQEAWR